MFWYAKHRENEPINDLDCGLFLTELNYYLMHIMESVHHALSWP